MAKVILTFEDTDDGGLGVGTIFDPLPQVGQEISPAQQVGLEICKLVSAVVNREQGDVPTSVQAD